MTVTGLVAKGLGVASGPLLYLKSDVTGPPTDAEFTTLGVTNITDSLACFNSIDLVTYVRTGGVWTTRVGHQRQYGPSYVCWFDGTNYRADSMTGGTNYSSTSNMAGPINSAFSAMVTANRGGWVHVRAGDYPMGTGTPAITLGQGNVILSGEGGNPDYSAAPDILSQPATRFKMGANNQTLIRGTTGGVVNLLGVVIRDICFETNTFTGGIPIDLTASNNLSSAGTKIERVYLNNILSDRLTYSGSFATGLVLDGCADMVVDQVTDGLSRTGGTSTVCTTADISFNHPSGDLTIKDSVLISTISVQGVWQTLRVMGGSYATFKLTVAPSNPGFTRISDSYLGPSTSSPGDIFNANGFAADTLEFDSCWIRPGKNTGGAATRVVFLNGGTLDTLIIRGSQIDKFSTNTISITDSAANCGRRRIASQGTRTTGSFTSSAPFTIDSNGYLADPGYTTTTPSFPSTNADQQNTNGYPVIVLVTGTGSGITAYGLTDPAGTLQSFTTTVNVGNSFTVGAGSKIRFTYTGSPTWKWYGVNTSS